VTELVFRALGRRPLADVWAEMKAFTDQRGADAADEVWFTEHPPVFTLGLNADRSHVLAPGDIDVLQIDRGGQVTYHGPGQLVAYVLLDLRRRGLDIRRLVTSLENAVIASVEPQGVTAVARRDAPGVYVDGRKFAALGLRVRRGCTYHGLAVNVAMDLEPFRRIDPCGYADLEITELRDFTSFDSIGKYQPVLEAELERALAVQNGVRRDRKLP